jgi:hypothetical protein
MTPTPKPSPQPTVTSAPTSENCYPFAVKLDFFNANLTINNLGGKGPEFGKAEEIRYSRVGTYNNEFFDLVITVASGSYLPQDVSKNGQNGKFGQVRFSSKNTSD